MPSLTFHPADADLGRLLRRLNADPDVVFLVDAGGRAWTARQTLPALTPGRYFLWYLPAGRLRLASGEPVEDPWQGWRSDRPDGPGVEGEGVIELTLASGYGRFSLAGGAPALERWWRGLARELASRPEV